MPPETVGETLTRTAGGEGAGSKREPVDPRGQRILAAVRSRGATRGTGCAAEPAVSVVVTIRRDVGEPACEGKPRRRHGVVRPVLPEPHRAGRARPALGRRRPRSRSWRLSARRARTRRCTAPAPRSKRPGHRVRGLRSCAAVLGDPVVLPFQLTAIWNNFFLPMVMLSDPGLRPTSLGPHQWNSQASVSPEYQPVVIMGSLRTVLLLILVFVLLQRFWRSGLTAGAVT